MQIHFDACPSGHSIEAVLPNGTLTANIYPPGASHVHWRTCFATCTGAFGYLQGKISDSKALDQAKQLVQNIADGVVSGYIGTAHGMRGHFAVLFDTSTGGVEGIAPQNTGIGSYKTATKAKEAARAWAMSDGIPFEHA